MIQQRLLAATIANLEAVLQLETNGKFRTCSHLAILRIAFIEDIGKKKVPPIDYPAALHQLQQQQQQTPDVCDIFTHAVTKDLANKLFLWNGYAVGLNGETTRVYQKFAMYSIERACDCDATIDMSIACSTAVAKLVGVDACIIGWSKLVALLAVLRRTWATGSRGTFEDCRAQSGAMLAYTHLARQFIATQSDSLDVAVLEATVAAFKQLQSFLAGLFEFSLILCEMDKHIHRADLTGHVYPELDATPRCPLFPSFLKPGHSRDASVLLTATTAAGLRTRMHAVLALATQQVRVPALTPGVPWWPVTGGVLQMIFTSMVSYGELLERYLGITCHDPLLTPPPVAAATRPPWPAVQEADAYMASLGLRTPWDVQEYKTVACEATDVGATAPTTNKAFSELMKDVHELCAGAPHLEPVIITSLQQQRRVLGGLSQTTLDYLHRAVALKQ